VIDPNEVCDIQDYSAETLAREIDRLLASSGPEHFIYRECELDEIWRLLDLDISSLRASGGPPAEVARLERFRGIIMQAHDSVGVAGDPTAAAQELRALLAGTSV
jgi:hypothetical protein